ncbi:MAG: sulfatase-like hydrolase/transferase [Actinomycetota bacterium]
MNREPKPLLWSFSIAALLMLPFFVEAFHLRSALDGVYTTTPLEPTFISNYYHSFEGYGYLDYNAATAVMAALTGLGLLVQRRAAWVLRAFAFVALVITANLARNYLGDDIGRVTATAGAALFAVAALIVLAPGGRGAAARSLVAAAGAAVGAMLLVDVAVGNVKLVPPGGSPFARHYNPPPAHATGGRRLVVVLFDEWDYRLTFEAPQLHLRLPNIERLRQESLFVTNAQRPGAHTLVALPSLLTGRRIVESTVEGPTRLMIAEKGGTPVPFDQQTTLFDTAARNGRSVALVSNPFHPYCSMFDRSIADCWGQGVVGSATVLDRVPGVLAASFKYFPGVRYLAPKLGELPGYPADYPSPGQAQVETLLDQLERRIVDDRVQFVFCHLLTPHVPYFWDRQNDRYIQATFDKNRYVDQLEYVDRVIGRLMHKLESSPLAPMTDVVFMTDHNWRKSEKFDGIFDPRVPFIVHLGGMAEGRTVSAPVDLSRSGHRVLERLLASTPAAPAEIEALLTQP